MQAWSYSANGNDPNLSIISPGIVRELCIVPVETKNIPEINPVNVQVCGALGLIPFERADPGHGLCVATI